MRVVFICQWNPWRLNGGALIRNTWLLRALASRYDVDLVTADDPSSDVPPDFAAACASISRFPRMEGVAGRAVRAVEMMRPDASFYTSGSTVPALRAKVRELTSREGSVAMLDLRMIDALAGLNVPFVYNAHNTEHCLLSRRADYERQPVRSLLRWESARVARIEARVTGNARVVAACSENDRRELLELAPQASERILVVPNGVDVQHYDAVANTPGESRTLLITGSFDWRPNLIGLDWFLAEVLPALRARIPNGNYTIRVAGRMGPELIERLNHVDNISAVPNPKDMRDELARACIVVAPIIASSGTRLRILEAWAAGRPVVTTTAGALGLRYRDDEELLVADSPAEFADAIVRALDDGGLRQHLRDTALLRAGDYDWGRIGADFLDQAVPLLEPGTRSYGARVASVK